MAVFLSLTPPAARPLPPPLLLPQTDPIYKQLAAFLPEGKEREAPLELEIYEHIVSWINAHARIELPERGPGSKAPPLLLASNYTGCRFASLENGDRVRIAVPKLETPESFGTVLRSWQRYKDGPIYPRQLFGMSDYSVYSVFTKEDGK